MPCNPNAYLTHEYGPRENWLVPTVKKYSWTNLERKFKIWSHKQWPYAVKFFSKNGTFEVAQTLGFINAHGKLNLTKLPDDVLNL